MAFDIKLQPAAKRALLRLPTKASHAVIEFVYGALADNPHRVGKPLTIELAGLHSARRGDYRILYTIDDDRRQVEIDAIEHRSDAYRRR